MITISATRLASLADQHSSVTMTTAEAVCDNRRRSSATFREPRLDDRLSTWLTSSCLCAERGPKHVNWNMMIYKFDRVLWQFIKLEQKKNPSQFPGNWCFGKKAINVDSFNLYFSMLSNKNWVWKNLTTCMRFPYLKGRPKKEKYKLQKQLLEMNARTNRLKKKRSCHALHTIWALRTRHNRCRGLKWRPWFLS